MNTTIWLWGRGKGKGKGRGRVSLSDILWHVQIHWFSIINSCVTVLLLTGFLATILMRVLKNDFIKYTRDDEAGESCQQLLYGWRM